MDELRRLQERGVTALSAALAALPTDTQRLVVGFSGGRDSSALLDVCCRLPADVALLAVHVCHGLDPQADVWAAFCERRAADYGIAFQRLDVDVDIADGGLEAAARRARYAAVADMLLPGDVFCTAHHGEDQAQTVLIQALRGAGMRGLAGMPEWRSLGAGRHWRPWLAVSRQEIADHAAQAGLDWVNDPSNTDPARDRGYIDAALWPAITRRWPAAADTLSRVAVRAAEARRALDRLAAIDLADVQSGPARLSIAGLMTLSSERRQEVLIAWCREYGAAVPGPRQLNEVERLCHAREHSSPRVSHAAHEIRRFDGQLFLMPTPAAPPERGIRLAWSGRGVLDLPGDAGQLIAADNGSILDDLVVGFRQGGERLAHVDGHTRSLKQVLQAKRVAPWIRERMPLVFQAGVLVAVADRWVRPGLDQALATQLAGLVWSHGLVGD